jgi:hypothetical protein
MAEKPDEDNPDDGNKKRRGEGLQRHNGEKKKKASASGSGAPAPSPINTEDTIAKLEAENRELKKAAERDKRKLEQLERELDHRKRTTEPPSAFRAGVAQDSKFMDASGKQKKFKGPEDRDGYFSLRKAQLKKIAQNILQVMLLMYALSFIPAQYTVNHISVSTPRGEAYEFAPVYYQYILYASFVFLNTIHKLIF